MGPLPVWDLERRHVDPNELLAWTSSRVIAAGILADDLVDLHHVIDRHEALALADRLTRESRSADHRAILFRLLRAAMPELPWDEVAVQSMSHYRILVPHDTTSPAPPHTDRGIGHPLDERNVWIALTAARRSAALQVMPLAASEPIETERANAGHYLPTLPPTAHLTACAVETGDVLLFTPLHVHGARTVEEPTTRVSIDVRIAPAEAAIGRHPTGYVRIGARS